ncbi:MAG: hypothetical protein ACOY3P_12120 [Planctomycetota bacterium]
MMIELPCLRCRKPTLHFDVYVLLPVCGDCLKPPEQEDGRMDCLLCDYPTTLWGCRELPSSPICGRCRQQGHSVHVGVMQRYLLSLTTDERSAWLERFSRFTHRNDAVRKVAEQALGGHPEIRSLLVTWQAT